MTSLSSSLMLTNVTTTYEIWSDLIPLCADVYNNYSDGRSVVQRAVNQTSSFTSINYTEASLIGVTAVLLVMVIATAFGNFLVGLALFHYRSLRTVSNLLIGNLALSDFLLATTILPLSTVNECLGHWVFGRVMCSLWLSLDVLYCTASIWNLCMIAFDRYTATLYPMWYREKRSAKQAALYISLVWVIAAAICSPPIIGLSEPSQNFCFDDVTRVYQCLIFQSPGYVVYSASGSFYIPFLFTFFLYVRIFGLLRQRMKKMAKAREMSRSAAIRSRRHGLATLPVILPPAGVGVSSGGADNSTGVTQRQCTDCTASDKPERLVLKPRIYVELHSVSSAAGMQNDNTSVLVPKDHRADNAGGVSFAGPYTEKHEDVDSIVQQCNDDCIGSLIDCSNVNSMKLQIKNNDANFVVAHRGDGSNDNPMSESIRTQCYEIDTDFASGAINETFEQSKTFESSLSITTFAADGLVNGVFSSIGGISHLETSQSCGIPIYTKPFQTTAGEFLPELSVKTNSYVIQTCLDDNLKSNKYLSHNNCKLELVSEPVTSSSVVGPSHDPDATNQPPENLIHEEEFLKIPNNHNVCVHRTSLLQSRAQQPTMKVAAASVTASVAAAISPKLAKTAMSRRTGGMKNGAKDESRGTVILETRLHRRLDQRELRATIRMAFVISIFCVMWVGFFVVYVVRGLCSINCVVPRQLEAFFFWLGYSNSSVNPILYTLFNEDFRKAFEKILCGGCCMLKSRGEGGGRGKIKRRNNRFLRRTWSDKLNR